MKDKLGDLINELIDTKKNIDSLYNYLKGDKVENKETANKWIEILENGKQDLIKQINLWKN